MRDRDCNVGRASRPLLSFVIVMLAWLGGPAAGLAQGGTDSNQADERAEERKLTKAPKLVKEVEAEYTAEAIEAEIQGTVTLKIRIGKTGDVEKVQVVEGLGHGLDESAVEAVEQFKFEPAEVNGKPAPVVLNFRVQFTLPERPARFTGQVVDAESEKGLAGATVQLEYIGEGYEEPPTGQTTTDEEGRFDFTEVPPGKYRVQVNVAAHKPQQTTVELTDGDTLQVRYAVQPKAVNLAGTVREAGTRDPLSGVEVTVRDPDTGRVLKTDYTEKGGTFDFRGIERGTWEVRVSAQGYQPFSQNEFIEENTRTTVTYYVKADYYDAYTVTTTAEREKESINRQTVTLEEIRRIPGTGGDPVRAVQNLPGVARPPFGTGQIVVRGASPQSTKTFLQGDEIPLIYHFFGGPAVVSAEMIESVDFYPGNYRARYGRALAGIVDLQTRSPKMDRVHGYTEIDLLDATAQIEGPISDKVGFAASARRSYIDAILPAVLPEDTTDLSVAPRYYDYQGWLTWEPDPQHDLELFAYGSNDRVAALFDEPGGDAQVQITGLDLENAFYRGQLRWEWRPDSGEFENDVMLSYGLNKFGFEAANNLFFDLTYNQFQFREDFRWKMTDRVEFNAGLDVQAGWTDFSAEIPGFESSTPQSDPSGTGGGQPGFGTAGAVAQGERAAVLYPALYSELEIEPIEGLELIPGIRADYYNQVDEFAHSPRFNARWAVSDLVALKGGIGRFTQPPTPGTVDETFGNPEVTYEKAMQYSAGTEVTPLEYLEIDTTLFYQDLWDLVSSSSDTRIDPESGEAEPEGFDNSGEGRAWGVELLVRHQPANKFFGWLAYTLSWSQRKNLESGDWVPYQYDQRHILTMVAGYNLPWDVDVSARFRLVSGNPETPVVGSVYDVDGDEYQPVYGAPNSVRADTFHQLDVRVDKEFVFNTWRLGVYLDIINVYNAMNEEGTRYNYDYTESTPVTGLPIIPTLGVNARF